MCAMVSTMLIGCNKDEAKKQETDLNAELEVNTELTGKVTVGINSNFNTDYEAAVEAFKKAYKVKGPAVIDLTIKTDSVVLPMLKPGGTFNNLILRREDISDAEK